MWHVRRKSHLTKRYFFVGALYNELAIGKLDIGVTGLKQMGSNFLGLGFDFIKRLHNGRAPNRYRTRAIRAHAERNAACIAVHDVNILNRNTKTCSHHLGKGCLVALAMTMGAGKDRDTARRMHSNLAAFKKPCACTQGACDIRRCKTTGLDVAGIAHAAQHALCL